MSNEDGRGDWKYWHVLEAVQALNGSASVKEITAWLANQYPGEDHTDARANASLLSVNDPNRRHHDHGRKNFRSDQGNPKDVLFRAKNVNNVRYVLYNLPHHGVWDIQETAPQKWEAFIIGGPTNAAEDALSEAEEQVTAAGVPPIGDDHDARVWALRAVALRRGQPAFRKELMDAYDQRCAITGCGVLEILEAAHIRPYRGEHTHRVDNGLLLRADLHTLFDTGMIYIDAEFRVQIDSRLIESEYGALVGNKLCLPTNVAQHPNEENLAYHRKHTARQQL